MPLKAIEEFCILAKDHDDCAFYRVYFDKLPISLWHFDMSATRQDFQDIIAGPHAPPSPTTVKAMMAKVKLLEVNAATRDIVNCCG